MSSFPAASFYLLAAMVPAFLSDLTPIAPHIALTIQWANLLVLAAAMPLGGCLADVAGRLPVQLACCCGGAALSYPLWMLLGKGSPAAAWVGQLLMMVATGVYQGAVVESEVRLLPKGVSGRVGVGLSGAQGEGLQGSW